MKVLSLCMARSWPETFTEKPGSCREGMSAGGALHPKSVPRTVGLGEAPIAPGILLSAEI